MPVACENDFGRPKKQRCWVSDQGMTGPCDCKVIIEKEPVQISVALMMDLMEWSQKTFKFGRRWLSILGHMKKEIKEVEKVEGQDPVEWADLVMLGMDGLWRCLAANNPKLTDEEIAKLAYKVIYDKLRINKLRVYPVPVDEVTPVEHVRD